MDRLSQGVHDTLWFEVAPFWKTTSCFMPYWVILASKMCSVVFVILFYINAIHSFWFYFDCCNDTDDSFCLLVLFSWLFCDWGWPTIPNPNGCMSCDQNQQVGDKVEEKLLETKLFYLSPSTTWSMDKWILLQCKIYCHLFCLP